MCVIPVEKEREQISNNFISVQVGTVWRDFKIKFINCMEDEKQTRADGGLQGAGSRYICDLCYATQESANVSLVNLKSVAHWKKQNKLQIFFTLILISLHKHNVLQ